MSERENANAIRHVRRVVTGHDARGLAIITADAPMAPEPIPGGIAAFAKLWVTNSSPADNRDEADGAAYPSGLTCPDGTVLRVVDFAPGMVSPMHKTHSIDYGIVLDGAIELRLDSGATTRLQPGDIVVQRGTNHAWANIGAGWARMVFVLIAAAPLNNGAEITP